MFRPKDWKNPCDLYMAGMVIRPNERAEDYEAGADAMLEKLKDSGTFTYGYHSPDIDDQEVSGYWVFIPGK